MSVKHANMSLSSTAARSPQYDSRKSAAKDNNIISQPDFTESHQVPRLPRKAAAVSTASKATTGLYRESPSAAPCHPKPPRRQRRPRRQPDSTESRQVPRLPCKAAAASTASKGDNRTLQRVTKSCACHAKPPRRQRRPVKQRPGDNRTLYRESLSAAPATQSGRGVNGVQGDNRTLQRVTKFRACHAKPPQRQRRPRRQPDSTESQVLRLPHEAAAASTAATQSRRGVNPSKQQPDSTESHQVPPLPRKAAATSTASKATTGLYRESPSAGPATQSRRGVNGVQGDKRTLQRVKQRPGDNRTLYRDSPSTAPATQSRRGVNGVQGDNRTLQRVAKCRACHARPPRRQRRPRRQPDSTESHQVPRRETS